MKNSISAITFNGQPLTPEVIAKLHPKRTRTKAFTNGISPAKSEKGAVVYHAQQKAQKVRVRGEVFAWKDKAPYVNSGESILGGIELTADENESRCHICGNWFERLATHIRLHKVSGREYKFRNGLNLRSSLNSTKIYRAASRKSKLSTPSPSWAASVLHAAKDQGVIAKAVAARISTAGCRRAISGKSQAEADNLRLACEAQRLSTLFQFSKQLGRTPTSIELRTYVNDDGAHILDPTSLRKFFGVKIAAIFMRAGVKPREIGAYCNPSIRRGNAKRFTAGIRRGFKGVSRKGNLWQARISHNGLDKYLGLYASPEEGRVAYLKAAAELYGLPSDQTAK